MCCRLRQRHLYIACGVALLLLKIQLCQSAALGAACSCVSTALCLHPAICTYVCCGSQGTLLLCSHRRVCAPNMLHCAALQDVAGCDEAKTEVMEFVNFLKVSLHWGVCQQLHRAEDLCTIGRHGEAGHNTSDASHS